MTSRPQVLLIGSPVAQSLSPVFQNAALEHVGIPWAYGVHECDRAGAIAAIDRLRSGAITGLNATMPHKSVAAEASDVRDSRVSILGVANTLVGRHGQVHATNTDVDGVARSISALGGPFRRAVVLGAGGAAAASVLALEGCAEIVVLARDVDAASALNQRLRPGVGSSELVASEWGDRRARELVGRADVVVNATPLGMKGVEPASAAFRAVGLEDTSARLLDLIYSREPTPFLRFANGDSMDGATMLVEQGAAAFELWTGVRAPIRVMYDALFGVLGRPTPSWVRAAED